jgi:DNA-directed RNA polymerase subunit H (RpoH/RPB5)
MSSFKTTTVFGEKDDPLINDIYKSHVIIHKMMSPNHRNSNPIDYPETLSKDSFLRKLTNGCMEEEFLFTERFKDYMVYWVGKIESKTFPLISNHLEDSGYRRGIIVVIDSIITTQHRTNLAPFNKSTRRQILELFELKFLKYYVFDQAPMHRVCSSSKKAEIISLYGSETILQKIRKDDVVCRFIGAKKGDLILIERDNEGYNEIVYRLVE